MTHRRAFDLVIELAYGGTLDPEVCFADDALQREREKQIEAIQQVTEYAQWHLGRSE